MHTLPQQMAKVFVELGGKIHYNKTVDSIAIENKKVLGVNVDGALRESNYVMCNADFPYAMKNLVLEPKAKGKYSDKKIDSMDYSCSCLVFYWGVKGTYDTLKVHNFIISNDLDTNLDSIFDGSMIKDPSIYLHIPSNADTTMAPDGHSAFYVLLPVSELGVAQYEYDEETIQAYRTSATFMAAMLKFGSQVQMVILPSSAAIAAVQETIIVRARSRETSFFMVVFLLMMFVQIG